MAPKRKGAGRPKKAPLAPAPPPKDEETAVSEDVPAQEAPLSDEGENPLNGSIDNKDDDEEEEAEPSPKKAKAEAKSPAAKSKGAKKGRKAKAPVAAKKAAAKKKLPAVEEKDEEDEEEEEADGGNDAEKAASDGPANVIIIEASKECNCFKTRAAKAQTRFNKSFPGLEVQVNPEKPRKGCFEIRDQKGNIYLSLLGMPRPFKKLKSLDFDQTIEEVIAKIK